MKYKHLILTFSFLLFFNFSFAQLQPAIVQDWADYIGYQDTIVRIPIMEDVYGNYVTAGFTVNGTTGADMMVVKYKGNGDTVWIRTYSGAGYNRDQATALALDSSYTYVAGSAYSMTTDYDFVILKYDSSGTLIWSSFYNGTADDYDVPSAIAVTDSFVYVTGSANNTGTLLDIVTIKLNKFSGTQSWTETYDDANLFDVPVAIEADDGGKVMVTGASQTTLTDWEFTVLNYENGDATDTIHTSGTSSGFDMVNAVKSDKKGNFYITGTTYDISEGFNITTIKIDAGDTIAWIADFNGGGVGGNTDEGNGIAVDDSGNVYVCGKMTNDNADYLIMKYDSLGNEVDKIIYDSGHEDFATAICFDSFGNIIVTGNTQQDNDTYNFYTIAYTPGLSELWHHAFDGSAHKNDFATNMAADANGNIYVTGQSQIDETPTYQQITIKYRTAYFIFPEDTLISSSMLFYPNLGQIVDSDNNIYDKEKVFNYTINQQPQIFFHQDSISFVLAKIDLDTATVDTLERISFNFDGGNIASAPLVSNTHDTSQVLNYFLGHCPGGITNVTGSEKLLYEGVYSAIDVIFSNNSVGMKFQIVLNPGSDLSEVKLHFTGHQNLQFVNSSDLEISGLLGSFVYERPVAYQLDEEGNRIAVGWLASYVITDDDVSFELGGDYDTGKPLVLECAREQFQTNTTCIDNLCYSTYLGGSGNDNAVDIVADMLGFVFVAGFSSSNILPFIGIANNGGLDAMVFKMDGTTGEIKWASFYGGSLDDFADGIDVDDQGDVYVKGTTFSDVFIDPTDVTINPNHNPGYYGGELHGPNTSDAFIMKLSGISIGGGGIIWANYLGSTNNDLFGSITVDKTGDNAVYVGGTTLGTDFPTMPFTGAYNQTTSNGDQEGYVMKFDQSGTLIWSTYFGSDAIDQINDIKIVRDASLIIPASRLYISGGSSKTTYDATTCAPPTSGGFPNCSQGGAVQFSNNGFNTFIAEFNALELEWTTFITSNSITSPEANSIAAYDNTVYVKLSHSISNAAYPSFPTCSGCYMQTFANNDGYIARFDSRQFTWATFWGGGGNDIINGIYTNGSELFITGKSNTQTYQTTNFCSVPAVYEYPLCDQSSFYYVPNINPTSTTQIGDAFIASFNSLNQLIWSTYIGGNMSDEGLAFTSFDNYLFLVGNTQSHQNTSTLEDYPLVSLAFPGYNQAINSSSGTAGFLSRFDVGLHIGIDELIKYSESILTYPNPSTGEFTFEFAEIFDTDLSYSVENVFGQLIKSGNINLTTKDYFSLNISDYPTGIYFVTFAAASMTITLKIIKE